MNLDLFASQAEFPSCWRDNGLMEGEFFERQAAEFAAEYGASRPLGGTEHWRYASFLHWLDQVNDTNRLGHLLQAALADPDPPMAGNVLMSIVGKASCTQALFEVALAGVTSNPAYYVSPSQLLSAFKARAR